MNGIVSWEWLKWKVIFLFLCILHIMMDNIDRKDEMKINKSQREQDKSCVL